MKTEELEMTARGLKYITHDVVNLAELQEYDKLQQHLDAAKTFIEDIEKILNERSSVK